MVKWQPFASLPEQAGYIKKILYEQNKIEKPELSPEQQEELNHKIKEAYYAKEKIQLSYYHDGYIYLVEGIIDRIDLVHQGIEVRNGEQCDRFAFSNILSIEMA